MIGIWNRLQEAELLATKDSNMESTHMGFPPLVGDADCCYYTNRTTVKTNVDLGAVIALRMIRKGHSFRLTVSVNERVVIEQDVTNGGMWPNVTISARHVTLALTAPFTFVGESVDGGRRGGVNDPWNSVEARLGRIRAFSPDNPAFRQRIGTEDGLDYNLYDGKGVTLDCQKATFIFRDARDGPDGAGRFPVQLV